MHVSDSYLACLYVQYLTVIPAQRCLYKGSDFEIINEQQWKNYGRNPKSAVKLSIFQLHRQEELLKRHLVEEVKEQVDALPLMCQHVTWIVLVWMLMDV